MGCGWLAGWLVGWLAGRLVGWLAGWLSDWLAGWLSGWGAGWRAGWRLNYVNANQLTLNCVNPPTSLPTNPHLVKLIFSNSQIMLPYDIDPHFQDLQDSIRPISGIAERVLYPKTILEIINIILET